MDDGIGDDTALREKYWELTPKHKRALIGADPVSSAKAKVTFALPDWCREHLTKLRT